MGNSGFGIEGNGIFVTFYILHFTKEYILDDYTKYSITKKERKNGKRKKQEGKTGEKKKTSPDTDSENSNGIRKGIRNRKISRTPKKIFLALGFAERFETIGCHIRKLNKYPIPKR